MDKHVVILTEDEAYIVALMRSGIDVKRMLEDFIKGNASS